MLKKTKTRTPNSSQKPKNTWKIPNQKVFVLRKSVKFFPILILAILIGLGAVMLSLVLKNPKSFLAYHDKNEYRPLYDEGDAAKGFYGKVNYYLNEALKDVDSTLEKKLTVSNLSKYYKRLDFFAPSDSLNYLKRNDEYRLIGFIPDSTKMEEVNFYYNSDFRRLIASQAKIENLTDRFFNIEFDKKNYPKISKISVDTTRLKMLLFNRVWDGHISLMDPIKEIDSGVLYCYGAKAPFPLFTESSISCETSNIYATRGIPADTFGFSEHIANYLANNRNRPDRVFPTKITYDNNKNSIWLLNTAHGLMVGNDNQNSLQIIINDKDTIKQTAAHCVKKAELVNGISMRVTSNDQTQKYYYITPASPYQLASQPVNGSISGARFRIDSTDVGFSIWQKMMHLESVLQQSDSQRKVSLSLNVPLSRYLEQQIIRYVQQLKQDETICDPGSNDIIEMSVCLMDVATGEVLADPFYGNYFSMDNLDEFTARRNFNLELHDVGSTFKPPLYFAAALKFPALGQFALSWQPPYTYSNDSSNTKILGYQSDLYGWKKGEGGRLKEKLKAFWSDNGPAIDRVNAIATSHDNYPITVALLSLVEQQDTSAFLVLSNEANFDNRKANNLQGLSGKNGLERIVNTASYANKLDNLIDLNKSSYYQLLAHLYDVQVLRNSTERVYDNRVIPFLSPTKVNFLSPELTSIFDTAFQGAKGYGFPSFRSDILGQGNNRWSNLKLVETYARILTFNKVYATYIEQNKEKVHFDDLCSNTIKGYPYLLRDTAVMHNAWRSFKQDWQEAVKLEKYELLHKAYKSFVQAKRQAQNSCYLPDGLEFYCKTGTPQEKKVPNMFQYGDTTVYVDEGLFAFGIVSNAQHPKGITGVVYIKHLSRSPIREVNGVAKGVESSEARDFLTEGRIKNILLFTQKRYQ